MSSIDLDFCRLCFRADGNISVFNYDCDDAWSLSDRIFECVSVQISHHDKLPQAVCQYCLDNVIKWCDFKTKCDRNQRSWFLWLKSLSGGTLQEIQEGLTENARQKSLELGYGSGLNSVSKSAFQRYSKSPRRNSSHSDVIIISEEIDAEFSDKVPRIESTQSLVEFSPGRESTQPCFQDNLNETNGYLIVQSNCLTENNENGFTMNASVNSDKVISDSQTNESLETESNDRLNKNICDSANERNTEEMSFNHCSVNNEKDGFQKEITCVGILDNCLDQDDEVESAFSNDVSVSDSHLEKSKTIGEENANNIDSRNLSNIVRNDSPQNGPYNFTVPVTPSKLVNSSTSILKDRLMKHCEGGPDMENPQPKRPDTPYPHDILKNMGPLIDVMSPSKALQKNVMSPLIKHNPSLTEPLTQSESALSSVQAAPQLSLEPVSIEPQPNLRPLDITQLINPPTVLQDRSDESSSYLSHQQFIFGVRVKEEPLSCEEEVEEVVENPYNNISIKTEPVDSLDRFEPQEEEEQPELPPPDTTYCSSCLKHFSAYSQLVRHVLESAIHKRVKYYIANGHKPSRKLLLVVSREVRRQSMYRRSARKQMKAMDNKLCRESGTSVRSLPSSDTPNNSRHSSRDLLECRICDLVLQSRSEKLKHENSLEHKRALEALSQADSFPTAAWGESLASSSQSVVPPSSTSYTCPFISCSCVFSDGGQLIVHMHTHGISLPNHEVHKQIELNKQQASIKTTGVLFKKLEFKKQLVSNKKQKSIVRNTAQLPKYTCRRCNQSFLKCVSLSNHMRRCRVIAPSKPVVKSAQVATFDCPICNKPQKSKKTLHYHIKTYHPDKASTLIKPEERWIKRKKIFCNFCNKCFPNYKVLDRHNNLNHSSCKFCTKVYSSRDSLVMHYRTTHLDIKDGSFPCYSCFQVFSSVADRTKHKREECSGKISFNCSECHISFQNQMSLDKHVLEHEVIIKPEVSDIDLSFIEDKQNTVCKICDKPYISYSNLKRHVNRAHCDVDSSVLECSTVNFPPTPTSISSVIETIKELPNHFEPGDGIVRNFGCFYCTSKFTSSSNRSTHMKKVCSFTPPKVVCPSCKSERWPWFEGPCQKCGKELKKKKRMSSIREECTPAKKVKPNECDTPSPANVAGASSKRTARVYTCPLGKRTFISYKSMLGHSKACNGSCKEQVVYCKTCRHLFQDPRVYINHKPCTRDPSKLELVNSKNGKSIVEKVNSESNPQIRFCPFCSYKSTSRINFGCHLRKRHNYYSSLEKKKNIKKLDESEPLLNTSSSGDNTTVNSLSEEPTAGLTYTDLIDSNDPTCAACRKTFPNHTDLKEHIRIVHRNKFSMLECAFCGKSILKRELYEHGIACIKNQLANINTLECVLCSNVFYRDDDDDTLSLKLQEHIINCCGKLTAPKGEKFKNKEKFLCLKCCMLFASKKRLYAHSFERHKLLVQTSPTSIKKVVGESVSEENLGPKNLQDMEASIEEETSSTDVSIKVISQNDLLFKCNRCSKRFKTPKGLYYHKSNAHIYQTRKKRKPGMKCKYCQRCFFDAMKLQNHEKVHGIVQESVRAEGGDNSVKSASFMEGDSIPSVSLTKQDLAEIIGTSPLPES